MLAEVDKRVVEIKEAMTEIDAIWKAYMATKLTPEESKLAEEFDANRRIYGRNGLLPAIAALSAP